MDKTEVEQKVESAKPAAPAPSIAPAPEAAAEPTGSPKPPPATPRVRKRGSEKKKQSGPAAIEPPARGPRKGPKAAGVPAPRAPIEGPKVEDDKVASAPKVTPIPEPKGYLNIALAVPVPVRVDSLAEVYCKKQGYLTRLADERNTQENPHSISAVNRRLATFYVLGHAAQAGAKTLVDYMGNDRTKSFNGHLRQRCKTWPLTVEVTGAGVTAADHQRRTHNPMGSVGDAILLVNVYSVFDTEFSPRAARNLLRDLGAKRLYWCGHVFPDAYGTIDRTGAYLRQPDARVVMAPSAKESIYGPHPACDFLLANGYQDGVSWAKIQSYGDHHVFLFTEGDAISEYHLPPASSWREVDLPDTSTLAHRVARALPDALYRSALRWLPRRKALVDRRLVSVAKDRIRGIKINEHLNRNVLNSLNQALAGPEMALIFECFPDLKGRLIMDSHVTAMVESVEEEAPLWSVFNASHGEAAQERSAELSLVGKGTGSSQTTRLGLGLLVGLLVLIKFHRLAGALFRPFSGVPRGTRLKRQGLREPTIRDAITTDDLTYGMISNQRVVDTVFLAHFVPLLEELVRPYIPGGPLVLGLLDFLAGSSPSLATMPYNVFMHWVFDRVQRSYGLFASYSLHSLLNNVGCARIGHELAVLKVAPPPGVAPAENPSFLEAYGATIRGVARIFGKWKRGEMSTWDACTTRPASFGLPIEGGATPVLSALGAGYLPFSRTENRPADDSFSAFAAVFLTACVADLPKINDSTIRADDFSEDDSLLPRVRNLAEAISAEPTSHTVKFDGNVDDLLLEPEKPSYHFPCLAHNAPYFVPGGSGQVKHAAVTRRLLCRSPAEGVDPDALAAEWAEAADLLEARVLDKMEELGLPPILRHEEIDAWVEHLPPHNKAKLVKALDNIGASVVPPKPVKVHIKRNEKLFKRAGDTMDCVARTIAAVHPDIVAFAGPAVYAATQRFKQLFPLKQPDGTPLSVDGLHIRIAMGPFSDLEMAEAITSFCANPDADGLLLVAGDDSLLLLRDVASGGWFRVEGDFSKFDQSQTKPALQCEDRLLRALGVDEETRRCLMASATMPFVIEAGGQAHKISRPFGMRNTGGVDTTLGNSGTTAASWLHVIRHTNCTEADMVDRFARLGLAIKLRVKAAPTPAEAVIGATFLKHIFVPAHEDPNVLLACPLPSRILKIGTCLRDPAELYRCPPREARVNYLADQALGLQDAWLIAPLDAFVAKYAGKKTRSTKWVDRDARYKAFTLRGGLFGRVKKLWTPDYEATVRERYGDAWDISTTVSDLLWDSGDLAFLSHPLFEAMAQADYA